MFSIIIEISFCQKLYPGKMPVDIFIITFYIIQILLPSTTYFQSK